MAYSIFLHISQVKNFTLHKVNDRVLVNIYVLSVVSTERQGVGILLLVEKFRLVLSIRIVCGLGLLAEAVVSPHAVEQVRDDHVRRVHADHARHEAAVISAERIDTINK